MKYKVSDIWSLTTIDEYYDYAMCGRKHLTIFYERLNYIGLANAVSLFFDKGNSTDFKTFKRDYFRKDVKTLPIDLIRFAKEYKKKNITVDEDGCVRLIESEGVVSFIQTIWRFNIYSDVAEIEYIRS